MAAHATSALPVEGEVDGGGVVAALGPGPLPALGVDIDRRYRALVLVGAYGGLRIGELAELRRSRVDLLRGMVQVAEIVVEVRGVLQVGRPRLGPAGAR